MSFDFVYLASGSPRRRELLQQIGVPFRLVQVAVDEAVLSGESAAAYVNRLALAKSDAGWQRCGGAEGIAVLAADTAVVHEGQIFGKPAGRADAESMLRQLSGKTHEVLTAVALRTGRGSQCRITRSEVTLRAIDAGEARAYWETGEPCDKAGGYAVQGRAAIFIADLRGSYSGVMGLPLFETAQLLGEAGIASWQRTGELP